MIDIFRIISLSLILSFCFAGVASAQQQHKSDINDILSSVYDIGLQTGQLVERNNRAQDDKLKWVLDNWVSKKEENANQR